MDKKQAQHLEAKAYWQRVADIGRQQTQAAKMAAVKSEKADRTERLRWRNYDHRWRPATKATDVGAEV